MTTTFAVVFAIIPSDQQQKQHRPALELVERILAMNHFNRPIILMRDIPRCRPSPVTPDAQFGRNKIK